MPAPNLGSDYALAVRLANLEDQVRRLQANPYGQALSASQSDGSVGLSIAQDPTTGGTAMTVYQGPSTARDASTNQHPRLMFVGQLYQNGTPEDAGVIVYYPSGHNQLSMTENGFIFSDPKANIVVSNDQASGEGMATPWLPLPTPQQTGTGNWPKTASTSLGTVAESLFRASHPKVFWSAQGYADAGTNGTVQASLVGPGGVTVTGASWSVTGGSFTSISDVLTLPAGFHGNLWTFQVQAQVTSGTGNTYAETFALYGRQS